MRCQRWLLSGLCVVTTAKISGRHKESTHSTTQRSTTTRLLVHDDMKRTCTAVYSAMAAMGDPVRGSTRITKSLMCFPGNPRSRAKE